MEGVMIRRRGLVFPGRGGNPRTPANQRSASLVGVSARCIAVSTRGTTVFGCGSSELCTNERISDPGTGMLFLACCWLHEFQPISDRPMGLRFPRRAGRYLPGGSSFSFTYCRSCSVAELHEPRPISDQPVGLGFQHHAERYRPGGAPFPSLARRSCRCV